MSYARLGLKLSIIVLVALLGASFVLKSDELKHSYLNHVVSPSVLMLTPPSNSHTGATGFAVTTEMGSNYVVTNAHVCRLAENGMLVAKNYTGSTVAFLNVIDISTVSDLCLLSQVPDMPGLTLAKGYNRDEELTALGHPLLEPLTHSSGFITNYQKIVLMVGINLTDADCILGYAGVPVHYEDDALAAIFGLKSACFKLYSSMRTSIVVYPGNSGSPIVNIYGHVVGVLFAANPANNYGYIVTLSDLKEFLSGR